jgi:hypothetical protein
MLGLAVARGNPGRRGWLGGGLLASLAACGGVDVPAGLEVLHVGEDEPSSIAVDDTYVYWVSGDAVRRAPLGGGPPVTLATGENVRGVVPAGEFVYLYDSSLGVGHVGRVSRDGGDVDWFANAEAPTDLVLTPDGVVWSDRAVVVGNGSLWRAARDGSGAMPIAEGLTDARGLVFRDGHIYFWSGAASCIGDGSSVTCSGGGIQRVPLDGGTPERLTEEEARSNPVITDDGFYWMAWFPPRIMFAPHDASGGAEREIANILAEGEAAFALRADGDALYWAGDDRVLRMPFESGEVTRLVTGLDAVRDVAPLGDWVYVAEGGAGRIVRVAADGRANRPSEPITGPCPGAVGSAAEVALTPRSDPNLERLALTLAPEALTIDTASYERVVADVAAIRTLQPTLADIDYRGADDGKTVVLGLTDIGSQSLAAGQYSAWDCLNDFYGLVGTQSYEAGGTTFVTLELKGIYKIQLLAELYAALPEVQSAEPSYGVGDGPTLCVQRDGDRYQYVVDRAGGDCPSGCTEHEAYLFASDAAGQVTAMDSWNSNTSPAPTWFRETCH